MKEKDKIVLFLDGYNLFIRAYTSNPTLSSKGKPFGGVVGFIGMLQKMCHTFEPSKIIVVWDGPNGAEKRRKILPKYKDKEGRKCVKKNRFYEYSPEEEDHFQKEQLERLLNYLNLLPIIQVFEENSEADDGIAYLTQLFPEHKKIIVSSDKDYLQLVNDSLHISLFRPITDERFDEKLVFESFGVHPINFAMVRSICGDSSDNISGIPRSGFKTLLKNFPALSSKGNKVELEEILEVCEAVEKKHVIHENLLMGQNLVRENFKITQLEAPLLDDDEKERIRRSIESYAPMFQQTEILKNMMRDGIAHLNWDRFISCMKYLFHDMRKEKQES